MNILERIKPGGGLGKWFILCIASYLITLHSVTCCRSLTGQIQLLKSTKKPANKILFNLAPTRLLHERNHLPCKGLNVFFLQLRCLFAVAWSFKTERSIYAVAFLEFE